MEKVNLFIIGAPKCGTTSLANYLNHHPQIFLSPIKEPHYFATEDLEGPHNNFISSLEQYNKLFFSGKKYAYYLDASVWYYSNEEIIKKIKAYNSDAKFIFLIRHPLAAIKSLYLHRLMALQEDQQDINVAVELENARKRGEKIPLNLKSTRQGLYYKENYIYSAKIKKYQEILGKENLKLVLFEDLIEFPKNILEDILNFLNLPPFESFVFLKQKHNVSKSYRNQTFNRMIKMVPKVLKRPINKYYNKYFDKKINNMLVKNNIHDFSIETISKLKEDFLNDIDSLEFILGKDLSKWKNKFYNAS